MNNFDVKKVESQRLFLGGFHNEDDAMCVSFINGSLSAERLMKCTNEEADDRMFFHANHAIKVGN